MSCKICCWIRGKWFKFTGIDHLQRMVNAQLGGQRLAITQDFSTVANGLESQMVDFRRAVKERFTTMDQQFTRINHDVFEVREWCDQNAEGKVSPQRERIVDLKLKVEKLERTLSGFNDELENLGIRLGHVEHPHPEKIKG